MKQNETKHIIEKLDRLERQVATLRVLLIATLALLAAVMIRLSDADILTGIFAVLSLLAFFVGLPTWVFVTRYRAKADEQDEAGWENLDTDGLPDFMQETDSQR